MKGLGFLASAELLNVKEYSLSLMTIMLQTMSSISWVTTTLIVCRRSIKSNILKCSKSSRCLHHRLREKPARPQTAYRPPNCGAVSPYYRN